MNFMSGYNFAIREQHRVRSTFFHNLKVPKRIPSITSLSPSSVPPGIEMTVRRSAVVASELSLRYRCRLSLSGTAPLARGCIAVGACG